MICEHVVEVKDVLVMARGVQTGKMCEKKGCEKEIVMGEVKVQEGDEQGRRGEGVWKEKGWKVKE